MFDYWTVESSNSSEDDGVVTIMNIADDKKMRFQ
jgi:hypothetical protein